MPPSLCVVLVAPEQAANVGFAARSLACYGLDDLRIVGSPGIASDGAARKTGKAVLDLLEKARYFPSLGAALADCGAAYGFTRRVRDPSQRIEDLRPVADGWNRTSARLEGLAPAALVFGRESQGLFREETLLITHLVRIPLASETLSLNLSHAVAIGLYAFLGVAPETETLPTPSVPVSASPAEDADLPTRGETAHVLDNMLIALEAGGFFKGGKQEAQKEYVRLLWQRMAPNRREFDFLAGLLRALKATP
ncbi:MAG: RNA methyltransferase [Fibrobacteria bacterium]